MKKVVTLSLALLAVFTAADAQRRRAPEPLPAGNLNFIVASDMGREGGSDQAETAAVMGKFADDNRLDMVAIAGDPIHDDGVKSTADPEWNIRIENIYTSPSLHAVPWYVVSGNHEYHGSVQAVLDYSNVSKRWNAPARYYTVEKPIGTSGRKALFVFLDTAPLIDKYRDDEDNEYTDAGDQDMEREVRWLDSVLVDSDHRWKIVIGHHPVWAATDKSEHERTDLQNRIGDILERNGVDFYVNGHIHNFQHIVPTGGRVNYITNSSASRSRRVEPLVAGSVFVNPEVGFTAFSVAPDSVQFHFVNNLGQRIYSQTVTK